MNKEAMKQQILEALSKKLGDSFRISIQRVLKSNMELDGLIIMAEDENISPTIYLEPFYEALENGVSINDVINKILQQYYFAKSESGDFDVASLKDFDRAKDRLYVQLLNKHLNKHLLETLPHTLFLDDFAIVVRCKTESSTGCTGSFLVSDHIVEMWQTDHETILSLALHNTRRLLGIKLIPMEEFIKVLAPETLVEPAAENLMWIMTNKDKLFGAATVLFDDVLKNFAKEHGSFCLIFSSVHEALLLPGLDDSDIERLTEMNLEVNATQVEENEILGTKAYYYDKNRGFVLSAVNSL